MSNIEVSLEAPCFKQGPPPKNPPVQNASLREAEFWESRKKLFVPIQTYFKWIYRAQWTCKFNYSGRISWQAWYPGREDVRDPEIDPNSSPAFGYSADRAVFTIVPGQNLMADPQPDGTVRAKPIPGYQGNEKLLTSVRGYACVGGGNVVNFEYFENGIDTPVFYDPDPAEEQLPPKNYILKSRRRAYGYPVFEEDENRLVDYITADYRSNGSAGIDFPIASDPLYATYYDQQKGTVWPMISFGNNMPGGISWGTTGAADKTNITVDGLVIDATYDKFAGIGATVGQEGFPQTVRPRQSSFSCRPVWTIVGLRTL